MAIPSSERGGPRQAEAPGEPDRLRDQRERASGAWSLVVDEPADLAEARSERLRRILRFKRMEWPALRRRLPGELRRGARVDLEPVLRELEAAGLCARLERRAPATPEADPSGTPRPPRPGDG